METLVTVCRCIVIILATSTIVGPLAADESPSIEKSPLANGMMELADPSGRPDGWYFLARPIDAGQTVSVDPEDPFEESNSALLDCSNGINEFANLMQSVDAVAFRGKRVRFRAAVKTAELDSATRVQLWFRVDRADGIGAFDNMQDRPIRGNEWKQYAIVLDVAEDAEKLVVGMFVIGSGKAWIDDAHLEVVADDTPSTSMTNIIAAAAAATAPKQPFFTPWLWLAGISLVLFVISQVESPRALGQPNEPARRDADTAALGWLPKFALRFAVGYWLLYCLPAPVNELLLGFGGPVMSAYNGVVDKVVRWTAARVLGIDGVLIAPNGSGDTTYAYVQILLCFVLAVAIAALWSAFDRGKTDCRVTKDVLRSYLRYVLAATMIGYGLAKAGFIQNQFPTPFATQLARTYGESSPMGLLWTFMGASCAYTFFAGLGEIVGGLLLLWRRTTTLGAIVVFGVMLNVMMLNLCYDVPVKQYSAHLVVMALFLLLPETKRLLNLFVLNRPTSSVDLTPPYVAGGSVWVQRVFKAYIVFVLAFVPIAGHTRREVQHAREISTIDASKDQSLLLNRGFRWVNEVPFNR